MGINSSAFGARRLPKRGSGKHFRAPAGADLLFPVGPDAPIPAREQGLQPDGALTLFFRWRKKSVQKKASGTATPGKRLLLPILTAGLAMSRAMELDSYYTGAERARARLFSADKMGGPFSLRCLSPPCPGAVGGGHTQPLQGGMLWRSLYFFARQKASGKSNPR